MTAKETCNEIKLLEEILHSLKTLPIVRAMDHLESRLIRLKNSLLSEGSDWIFEMSGKLPAIKRYKELHNSSLYEAKRVVELVLATKPEFRFPSPE